MVGYSRVTSREIENMDRANWPTQMVEHLPEITVLTEDMEKGF
jgi:hypothetical protein